jgi:hypothetical protein
MPKKNVRIFPDRPCGFIIIFRILQKPPEQKKRSCRLFERCGI